MEGDSYKGEVPSTSFAFEMEGDWDWQRPLQRSASTVTIEKAMADKKCRIEGDTQSEQLTSFPTERMSLMRRAFSIQFGKPKDSQKLDPETIAMIKRRYKDTSKYIIWPDCPIPEEYSRGFLTLNSDPSKRTAIRYSHAGNHQAAVLRLKGKKWNENTKRKFVNGQLDTFLATSSEGLEGSSSKHYHLSPSAGLPPTGLATVREEEKVEIKDIDESHMANIEDDRTPKPRGVINSIRRSESSDEEESVIGITSVANDSSDVSHIQIIRF